MMLINPYSLVPSDADPFWANVISLLHFDGADASTAFLDETGRIWSELANAHIETDESVFGGAAGAFDGAGDYLYTADDADFDFGSGDFTIEFWVYSPLTSDNGVISRRASLSQGWAIEIRSTGAVWLRAMIDGTYSDTRVTTAGGLITADTWAHVALCRDGDDWHIFIDGVERANVPISGALDDLAADVFIGRSSNTEENSFSGYIDELRITKGVARYVTDFDVPTAPFPDH